MRQKKCEAWESRHNVPFFWGGSSQTAFDKAEWPHSVPAGSGRAAGMNCAAAMLDLGNFEVHTRLNFLCEAALRVGFPLMLLCGFCVICAGERALIFRGASSATSTGARGAVIAGCSAATSLARLLLLAPLVADSRLQLYV
ncbi:unnamed protein product [Prorocentrum cordatum]|uniref:Uncharacterized protein n=1 Tax=Prorocentrum cordatum TaxID=2364126 RepID=A0ABN9PIK8_9DINO|nr:unnamed protein product [Polarella glacialis]